MVKNFSLRNKYFAGISSCLVIALLLTGALAISANAQSALFEFYYDASARKVNGSYSGGKGTTIHVVTTLTGTTNNDFTGTLSVYRNGNPVPEVLVIQGSYRVGDGGNYVSITVHNQGLNLSIKGTIYPLDANGNNFEVDLDRSSLHLPGDGNYQFLPNPGNDAYINIPP